VTVGLVITAAGSGLRYSKTTPKLLEVVYGKTILEHSVLAFRTVSQISECIVTCPESYSDHYASLLLKHQASLPFTLKCIEGGSTRMSSVKKAFFSLSKTKSVLIHDAARPNPGIELIQSVLSALISSEAVIPGLAVTDTIKKVKDEMVLETVDRRTLVAAQTPQGFSTSVLRSLYQLDVDVEITDESMLAEYGNVPIVVVPGNEDNIKLTHQKQLKWFDYVLSSSS